MQIVGNQKMHLSLWHKSEAKKIPKPVHEYMKHRFHFLPEYLDTLKCFEYSSQVNGKSVRRLRIFSPAGAQEQHLEINSNLDLERHPELLLYEGYIDYQGNAYVADRRAPLYRRKAV
jgi:hypothetical protein